MVFMGAFIIAVNSEESDAATAGDMNLYIYDGSTWYSYTTSNVYNALQALQATKVSYTAEEVDGYYSTDYVIQKSNAWGDYDEINSNYGNVASIMGVSEDADNIWNTYYYDQTADEWVVGPQELGFITPFTDGAAPSANVVLYYGSEDEDYLSIITNYMSDKTLASMTVPQGDDYEYQFYLKVGSDYNLSELESVTVTYVDGQSTATKTLEASDLYSGITVIGYGSTAYAALKDAVGSTNVKGTDTYGSYNGWLDSVFGLTTQIVNSSYVYWSQYDSTGSYLSFNLGAYSTLSNVPTDDGYSFVVTGIQLIYGS